MPVLRNLPHGSRPTVRCCAPHAQAPMFQAPALASPSTASWPGALPQGTSAGHHGHRGYGRMRKRTQLGSVHAPDSNAQSNNQTTLWHTSQLAIKHPAHLGRRASAKIAAKQHAAFHVHLACSLRAADVHGKCTTVTKPSTRRVPHAPDVQRDGEVVNKLRGKEELRLLLVRAAERDAVHLAVHRAVRECLCRKDDHVELLAVDRERRERGGVRLERLAAALLDGVELHEAADEVRPAAPRACVERGGAGVC
jgi:hypothetical protein